MKILDRESIMSAPQKPLALCDSSIGKLAVYSISSRDMESSGSFGKSCEPIEFARRLLPCVFHRDVSGEDQPKPDAPTLTQEDIAKFGEDEINSLVRLYIGHEPFLYRKSVEESRQDSEGKLVTHFSYGEVEHPQEANESNVQYLQRLFVLHDQAWERQAEVISNSFMREAHFSDQLSRSIANTLSMGNSLSRASRAMQLPGVNDGIAHLTRELERRAMHVESLPSPRMPEIDLAAIERNRRAPFEALGTRLDQLVKLTSRGIEFATESNRTQTNIAAELKASSDTATVLSRRNINLTVVVIALGTVTLLATVLMWRSDRQRSNADSQRLADYAGQLRTAVTDLGSTLQQQNGAASDIFKAILAEAKRDRDAQDARLGGFLGQQTTLITQLSEDREADKKTIDDLRQRLLDLDAKVRAAEGTGRHPVPTSAPAGTSGLPGD